MKRLSILLTLTLLVFCSCGKESVQPGSARTDKGGVVTEFSAVIDASKVSFDEGKLAWEPTDLIMISDGNVKSVYQISKIEEGVATFVPAEEQTAVSSSAARYTAVYPVEAFDEIGEISILNPGEETSRLPMGCVSTNAKLVFTNLCSLIKFSVSTNTENAALSSLKITADKPLSGTYQIVDGEAVMTGSAPLPAAVSCAVEDGFPISDQPLELYVVAPSGEYSKFDIEAVTSTGVKKVFPLAAKSISLKRSTIYSKTLFLKDLDVNDFREEGPANCYIATHKGKYRFATEYNEGTPVKGVNDVILVWTYDNTAAGPEEGKIISSLSYKDGVVDFSTDGQSGSALIAAVDSEGKILWSWHIWCSPETPADIVYPNAVMMDRYLGALSATEGDTKCVGFMYQYGRKDPFPGRVAIGNTIGKFCGRAYEELAGPVDMETAIANPNIRYYGTDSNFWTTTEARADATWNGDKKTLQDPCPYGYRVPSSNILGTTVKADIQKMFTWVSSSYGADFKDIAWYPATGQLAPKGKNLNSGTSISFGWGRDFNSNGNPLFLDIRSSAINGWGGGAAAAGFAVRCEKSSK